MLSASILLALAAFVASNPVAVPQGLDFDALAGVPDIPLPSIAVGVASQIITVDVASMISAATLAPLNTPSPTGDPANFKRQVSSIPACTSGTPQPTGWGPVPIPDTAAAFEAYAPFDILANAAATPSRYVNTFKNLNASAIAYGYLGFTTFESYDVASCAAKCDSMTSCHAFNFFLERTPKVEPGSGINCWDPPSFTQYKCSFWSGPVDTSNAVNFGQYREDFHVMIAGSNGYVKYTGYIPSGYTAPYYAGDAAINAPLDCNGRDAYLGFKLFNDNGPFDIQRCSAACTAQAEYEMAHPPAAPAKPRLCSFFNTYVLKKNNVPIGQVCSLYSQTWTTKELTNTGQYDQQGNHYTISFSYISSNATNPGTCAPLNGGNACPVGLAPGICGTYHQFDYKNNCFCGYDTTNETVAFQSTSCLQADKCSSNADCEFGSVCLREDNCCGFALCNLSSVCLNTLAPRNLFKRLRGKPAHSDTMERRAALYSAGDA